MQVQNSALHEYLGSRDRCGISTPSPRARSRGTKRGCVLAVSLWCLSSENALDFSAGSATTVCKHGALLVLASAITFCRKFRTVIVTCLLDLFLEMLL